MTSMHALGVLAIRLLAVWLLVMTTTQSVGLAAMLIQSSSDPAFSTGTVLMAAALAITAVIAAIIPVLMILLARRAVRWMIPVGAPDIDGLSLDAEGLSRLAMSMIGLFLIADALPKVGGAMINLLADWGESLDPTGQSVTFTASVGPGMPEHLAAFILGVALFLAAFRIGPFLRPLRRAGTGAHLDEDSTAPSQSTERS